MFAPESGVRERIFGWDAKGRASRFSCRCSLGSETSRSAASGAGAWPEYGSGGGCWGHRRLQKMAKDFPSEMLWASLLGVLGFGFVTCKWQVFTYLLLRLKRGFLRGFSCEITHSHGNYNFFFSFSFFFFFFFFYSFSYSTIKKCNGFSSGPTYYLSGWYLVIFSNLVARYETKIYSFW